MTTKYDDLVFLILTVSELFIHVIIIELKQY